MRYFLKSGKPISNLKPLTLSNSKGNLQKWTATINGSLIFIKTHSHTKHLDCFECEVECVACRLAVLLGLKPIMYYLDTLIIDNEEHKVCYSYDFTGAMEYRAYAELVPDIASKHGVAKYNHVLGVEPRLKSQIDTVLVFDAIIGNEDRHLRNLGILTNGKHYFIPIFDNGNSLFYNKSIDSIGLAMKTSIKFQRCRPFHNTIGEQLKLVDFSKVALKKVNRVDVYKLVNMYFKGVRARLINRYLCNQLRRFNLLWEKLENIV